MVESALHIRRATVQDASLLQRLSEVTFYDTFKDTCTEEDMAGYLEEYYNLALITRELADPTDYYFLIYDGDTAAGYMRLKEEESEVEMIRSYRAMELKRIYVDKAFLGRRMGTVLMNFALDFAREKKYEVLWLGVWEYNHRARAFYGKFGFKETGQSHPFPIGNTPQTDIWLYRFIREPAPAG